MPKYLALTQTHNYISWWVAHEIMLSSPGTGDIFQFQLPIPNPSTSRLTILIKHDYMLLISYSLTRSNPHPRSSVPFRCPPCVAPPRCSPPCAPKPRPAPRCCRPCSTAPRAYSSLLSSM